MTVDSATANNRPTFWSSRILDGLVLIGCVAFSLAFAVVPNRPAVAMPDFATLDTSARKEAFFAFLQPMIADVNEQVRHERDFVAYVAEAMAMGTKLTAYERQRLVDLATRYEVETNPGNLRTTLQALQRRTGTVPTSLVLIQAAKESGWGTSRFAMEGNNLFGQRCYQASDCGMRPKRQATDAGWGVARYDSVRDSLHAYVMNLNTHPEYLEFRRQRQEMRQRKEPLSGLALAASLDAYSERGPDYVEEIQAMIRQNRLE